ncbi:MAG: mechanosensitive ion channel [Oscillospiraceae bacterium]|nr:mechanosensitive ion channel [Oscillospiraceae bacterium]
MILAANLVSEEAASTSSSIDEAFPNLSGNPEETLTALGKFFNNIWEAFLRAIPSILLAIAILVVGIILTKICVKLMSKGLSKTKLDLTVVKFTTQVTKILLYVLLLTVVLSMVGIPATSIITVIGTAGVAIGLALQNSLSNVAGGFLLMITKPFKIGDYIISNGVEGTVSQISILHTRLDSVTNQAIFIPNGLAVNAVVVNNSQNAERRVDLDFSISYKDDFELARQTITDIIKAHDKVNQKQEIFVRMSDHGESAIIITSRCWCKSADYWQVHFDLIEQVRAAFIEKNIEIPFKQIDININALPEQKSE